MVEKSCPLTGRASRRVRGVVHHDASAKIKIEDRELVPISNFSVRLANDTGVRLE